MRRRAVTVAALVAACHGERVAPPPEPPEPAKAASAKPLPPPRPPDQDRDEIADSDDDCPHDPESYNGYLDADGCPDRGIIPEFPNSDLFDLLPYSIMFLQGRDVIAGESDPSVALLADKLVQFREIRKVVLAGFTDADEAPGKNEKLSLRRAQVLYDVLVSRGVEPGRLIVKGFGSRCPLGRDQTPRERERNRTVRIWVVEVDRDGSIEKRAGDRCVPGPEEPPPDDDGDRIWNSADRCPTDPELDNGYQDDDGCPDQPTLKDFREPYLLPYVVFERGKDVIQRESAESVVLLGHILRKHPQLLKVELAGFTDAGESPGRDQKLSERRAQVLFEALVRGGVEPERMIARGYGSRCPLAKAGKPAERVKNRTVRVWINEHSEGTLTTERCRTQAP